VNRKVEILGGLVLAAAGVMVALAAFEVLVRVLHLVPDRFWRPHPKTGVQLIPGKQGWWTQEEREFVVPVAISPQGLRDVPHTYDKPPGVLRVLVLGDSFVEAMHVHLEETFTRRLETLLDGIGANRRVEVISAGVSGWGTASELLWLRDEGAKYNPDIVLLHFYPGNDIKNNSPDLEDVLPPVYDDSGRLLYVRSNKPEREKRGGVLARSKAYVYLRQLVLVRQPLVANWLAQLGVVQLPPPPGPRVRDGLPVDFGVYRVPPDDVWRTAWQRTEGLLEEMLGMARALGARFGVVIASSREQVYPEAWEKILAAYPTARDLQFDLDQPQKWMEDWCRRSGVPCLVLSPAFRAAAARGAKPLHFWHDGHWTAAGHALAAEEMRKFLLANFPLS